MKLASCTTGRGDPTLQSLRPRNQHHRPDYFQNSASVKLLVPQPPPTTFSCVSQRRVGPATAAVAAAAAAAVMATRHLDSQLPCQRHPRSPLHQLLHQLRCESETAADAVSAKPMGGGPAAALPPPSQTLLLLLLLLLRCRTEGLSCYYQPPLKWMFAAADAAL